LTPGRTLCLDVLVEVEGWLGKYRLLLYELCPWVCEEDLHARGVRRLMVEGGGAVHTQFLAEDVVDELQLVVAPFFVGAPGARRFVGEAHFPWHPGRRARLAETRQLGPDLYTRGMPNARTPTYQS